MSTGTYPPWISEAGRLLFDFVRALGHDPNEVTSVTTDAISGTIEVAEKIRGRGAPRDRTVTYKVRVQDGQV